MIGRALAEALAMLAMLFLKPGALQKPILMNPGSLRQPLTHRPRNSKDELYSDLGACWILDAALSW